MKKIPFEIVSIEVDKLYEAGLCETHQIKIDAQIKYIVAYLQACGWSEEEFLKRQLFNLIN